MSEDLSIDSEWLELTFKWILFEKQQISSYSTSNNESSSRFSTVQFNGGEESFYNTLNLI